jgi:hypothetical protein
MVYRTSHSVAALAALLAACFALIDGVANAGDKIEFSTPSVLLEVPQPEREVKQDAATAINVSFSRHHANNADESYSPTTTIIIPAQKSRDRFGWTAPFEDARDQDERSGLDLFAPKKVSAETKSGSISNDKDAGSSKDGDWTESDPDHSRIGTDAMQKDGERGEDRLVSRLDSRGTPDWFRIFDSHAPAAPERMHPAPLAPGKEDFGAMNKQTIDGFSQPNPLGSADPLHSSAYPSGNLGNDLRDESLRGQSEEQVLMQPSMVHAWDVMPSAAHPQRPLVREQPYSAPSRAPSAPAVLGFPKRPGALFQ